MARGRALVVGRGIGGLSAALALGRVGFEVTVFEAAEELREAGAGITVWSNAVRGLRRLGLGDNDLPPIGMPATLRTIRTWRGDLISAIRVDRLAKGLGEAILIMHRARLHETLLRRVGAERVVLGARCLGVTDDGAGVRARFADGREVCGDLVVGADGIHSTVREQLFPHQHSLRYQGYSCWRGIASIRDPTIGSGVSNETWGCGRRIGLLPMTDGIYWFACRNAPAGQGREQTPEDRKREVRGLFRGWHTPIEAVIEATEVPLIRTDVYDLPPLPRWSRGRTTLLGDAAHAMTPDMAQGACQAIEDAVVLGACLEQDRDVRAALAAYERLRMLRTATIGRQSRQRGWISQIEGGARCRARDLLFRHVLQHVLRRQMEGIVGYVV